MRISLRPMFLASCVLAAACNGGDGGGGDDDGVEPDGGNVDPPGEGFRIQTPEITIEAGQEITYCYYTTINLPRNMGVKKWSSVMTPGSHHLIVFFQNHDKAEGTIDQDCGGAGGGGISNLPVWTYSAQQPTQSQTMPTGIGMTVTQGQKAYVQMHYFNAGDAPIQARVTIDAEAYAETETYTPAAAYVTYNTEINIPPMSTSYVQGTCSVPDGTKFFTMSTHAHKRATLTRVTDGSDMVFESTNWAEPDARAWAAAPFYEFAGDSLTYRCEYDNRTGPTSGQTVREGDSAPTDEMCMAVGYYFIEGATTARSRFCVNSFLVP
jgi:hypothetical protein